MLTTLALAAALLTVTPIGPVSPQSALPATPADGLSQADLEELVAPIALYPDPLLANVLAGSVYPDEVKAAGAYVAKKGDPKKIAEQGWEPSVQALAEVPDALKMMIDFPDWTVAIGRAYVTQSQAVMAAVQTMRKRAWDNGALKSGPQQVVAQDGNTIIIQPANPQIIYVPTYSPQVVYVQSDPGATVAAGLIGFGVGVGVGLLISDMDCNWHGGCVSWGHGWHGGYYGGGNNNINIDNSVNINTGGNTNINSGNNTINNGNRPRPGAEGEAWKPNADKAKQSQWKNDGAMNNYRGVGEGTKSAAGKIPGKTTNTPIAKPSTRPSGSSGGGSGIGTGGANRPSSTPAKAPTLPQKPATMPASKPSLPASRPAAPSGSRPSGFDMSNQSKSAGQRGSKSLGGGSKSSAPAARPSTPAFKSAPKPAARSSGGGGGGSRGGGGGRGR